MKNLDIHISDFFKPSFGGFGRSILSILFLTVGFATTAQAQTHLVPTPEEEANGITVGDNTYKPLSKIKIAGNVFGGGDRAAVLGNTNVTINTGEYGGSIFGGGNGELEADGYTVKHSADVGTHYDGTDGVHAAGMLKDGTGDTHVTINGGEIVYYVGDKDNFRNIYGGGNTACNVAGNTYVTMNKGMITSWSFVSSDLAVAAWQHFYDNHAANVKQPVCALFGAGYGANTDVALDTYVDVKLGETLMGEYSKADLVAINNFITHDRPNPALSQKFVTGVLGGGYNGTVGAYSATAYAANPASLGINRDDDTKRTAADYLSNTHVNLTGSPYTFTVFGGGLGSKTAADLDLASGQWGSRVGAVFGGTKVNIQGGFIFGSVFGGGAGIYGAVHITEPREGDMPYINAAQVFRETDVTVNGDRTVIIGNVYGGGDIANTGWYTLATRPTETEHIEQVNVSLGKLDYTTSVHLLGGNVMGQVFGGANGRTKSEITLSHLIGAVIGSTNLQLGENVDQTDGRLHGTTVWNRIYGGCNVGCVYACAEIAGHRGQTELARSMVNGVVDGSTNVAVYNGKAAHDIFAGGFGSLEGPTSADISGNTFIYFKKAELEYEDYWDAATGSYKQQNSEGTYWGTESDVCHNLYGGGNVACVVKGNSHVYMSGAPTAPANFSTTDYYKQCIANVALPHFSVFGGGFGIDAEISGNAYSDINLAYGTGLHSIIGGGMNGPVGGSCQVHVGNDPMSLVHHVYGGGYYAPCHNTELEITRGTFLENVFGGSVMGNINVNAEAHPETDVATKTTIGLQDPGAGRHSSIDIEDEKGVVLRSYTYENHKNQITIGGNVYGANDVSGTVNGVAQLTIYGGIVKGEVYGAGNGNHVGYYVPDKLRYDMGAHGSDNYFIVDHTAQSGPKGNTYVGRPQTIGGVELTLEGNTTDERVRVLGQVFGGGNSCTIGDWNKTLLTSTYAGNPHLVRDDPTYFMGGGKLYVNIGSHVTIGRTHEELMADAGGDYYISDGENVSGLFMGCSGRNLATQTGEYEKDNYYHHYFDAHAHRYFPGFAVDDENGSPMDRATQLKPFQAYLNNVMVWTDKVRLRVQNSDDSAAEDIWLANFVGGGFRGSMRAKTIDGKFDYTLPEGVTVSHTIVGGAYNAHVKYHYFATDDAGNFVDADHDGKYDYATTVPAGWTKVDPDDPDAGGDYIDLLYEDEDHPEQVTGILRYNFNGGMLSENSTGVNSSDVGHHIHKVHADPRVDENEYATAYFEPLNAKDPGAEDDDTRDKLFTANKDKALLHLTLKCALEPEVLPKNDGSGENYAHGGNVFGGCFMSGFVEGDSWVDYHCWLAPKCANSTEEKYKYFFSKTDNMHIYDDAGDLDTNNALSVYGAGYGADTHSDGDVYLYIKSIALNALGDADPAGMFPYIFNAFGGSNMGTVAGNTNVYYAVGKQGTLLGSLYGGGFKGVIEGNTFVEMAEGFAHNVYGGSRQADIHGASHVWAYDGRARGITDANHLIICNLYGGNDVAGTISGTMPATFTATKWGVATPYRQSLVGKQINTYVEISADDESADRGFPLVGSAFAGGNGEAWVSEAESGAKPEVATALIEIDGGSTLRAFGGGNMATVTGNTYIFTDARSNNFADVTFTAYQKNIVTKVFFSGMKTGFKWDDTRLTIDPFHVVRLFGGNNLATMDIQPTWNLKCGKIENVYSGGNMGDMTYYNPAGKPATTDGEMGSPAGVETLNADGSNSNYTPRGLSITIDQPDIYINSLFGGCRMSDVIPTPKGGQEAWPEGTDGEDFYGATVNITDGYIENVYGGNDVSGNVQHGTNVNISGAVSGNVYGSGNGFYLYKYDANHVTEVTEDINDEYGIFYHVPERDANGKLYDERGVEDTDTHKLLTINAVRPSVEKAFLNIAGLEHYPAGAGNPKRVAYVKGNVFCGGNASTITGDASFSKFKIGSYVTLNGVFMGSDGKSFTDNDQIAAFARINGFTDMGAATDFNAGYEQDAQHNPILLNTYMMAVDMKAQPKDFNLKLPLREAHIGTYCGGGNRGSMLVDKTVTLPFHHDIIIYDKIVAACLDANVKYNQNGTIIESTGGYTREIADKTTPYGNTKMKLDIASQFVPLVMDVPDNKNPETLNAHKENFETAKAHDFLYRNQTEGVKYTYQEFNELFEPTTPYETQEDFETKEGADHIWKEAPGIYAPSCNIYGGCYQSGEVVGDIELNVHSNMLRYVNREDLDKSIAQNIACFNVYGAGFGQDSHVWGNVTINVDRSLDTDLMGVQIASPTISTELQNVLTKNGAVQFDIEDGALNNKYGTRTARSYDCSYPSANNIIGGGRNGKLIGNATVEIRNGLVYSDVAGGCYASDLYGSTHVIVGYPKYYKCNKSGEYTLDRADKWNTAKKDGDGNDVIKQSVWYLKGDLVPENVYQQIDDDSKNTKFTLVDILPVEGKNTTLHTVNGVYDGTTWDDVVIKIGKGIYGGGYSLANSTAASAGSITTHKLNDRATTDIYPHNFNGRYGLDIGSTLGYGGNSSIMLGDQDGGAYDHIRVSTLKATVANIPATSSVIGKFIQEPDGRYTHQGDHTPAPDVTYYTLTGDGGIYGDGHLTFCEGFRSADVTRYGWADGTAKHPILMNTFQRMDLLSVNDCCLMLQGAQDFATDQIDATTYSITRINELRMNSTLDATQKLGEISHQTLPGGEGSDFDSAKQRNYLAFFNNVHYLGSIVTNDDFDDASHTYHNKGGALGTVSYKAKKQEYITAYESSTLVDGKKTADATNAFKQRNVGTARNAIGINNGYCLRIQNQEYEGTGASKVSKTYYGPVVGVCEVKLLTLVQGEGGGYVYADNIHANEDNFLMTSGNFVFPGIVSTDPQIGNQYIVDDCFIDHFGTASNITQKDGPLDEAHYWYVEGNKYFFTTTLTGFTYKKDATTPMFFNLTKTDPNIILSGMEYGNSLNVKKIEWLSTESGFHRDGYAPVLPNTSDPDNIDDYEFDIEVGGTAVDDWKYDLPRATTLTGTTTKTMENASNPLPQFNIKLTDKVDNSGDLAYANHLDEPELVKIYLEGDRDGQKYEYTITVNVVYLQGPTVTGGVRIENCALPGELIGFSTSGLKIKTPELMPITAASWQILPLKQINEHGVWEWDVEHGVVIPDSRYSEDPETQDVVGTIPALYKQNEYNIAYIFTAGGYDFPVMPEQKATTPKENRMIVVHNYHRMKDVVPQNLQIETMPQIDNNLTHQKEKHLTEAKLYIEDETDLRAFVNYLNMATAGNTANIPVGLTGLDIILQHDITLTQPLPAISQAFAGNFHGDGYHIDLGGHGTSFLGTNLTGSVYNLGLVGGTIATTGTRTNSFEYAVSDAFTYGQIAYDLSHHFAPGNIYNADGYVEQRYANGDYQYATTDRVWSLRTGAPNYGHEATRHDKTHTHDAARWKDTDSDGEPDTNVPLYDGLLTIADHTVDVTGTGTEFFTYHGLPENYANDYLFFGQHLDKTNADAYPVHIEPIAKGDPDKTKGGNRVYKTSGFYGSAADNGFCYNKDAWALQPTLTAIDFTVINIPTGTQHDFTGYTKEGDGATNTPSAFHSDSNADYNEDGTERTSSDQYSNASNGHVTQNLLVYRENNYELEPGFTGTSDEFEAIYTAGIYADLTPESDVRYHLLKNSIHNGASPEDQRSQAYSTDYFHLVDKQDFHAPFEFFVNNRGWYERLPRAWRNVATGYESSTAWEGLCLPFPFVTKVMGEDTGNELSHFFGNPTSGMLADPATNDRTLHHEYWLSGLVDASENAAFSRPSVEGGDGLFNDDKQYRWAPYVLENTYYNSLQNYSSPDNGHYGTRDETNWYASSHTFEKYPHITTGIPYLIAFPGVDFYEFNLTDQIVTFEFVSPLLGESPMYPIPATGSTDGYYAMIGHPDLTTTVNGYSHVGTYTHVTADASHLGINATGSAFEVTDSHILPFRTYMTTTTTPSPRRIVICDGGQGTIDVPSDEDINIGDLSEPTLLIYGQGTAIVVESNYDTELRIYTPAGRFVQTLQVSIGKNIYEGFQPEIYIVGGKKLRLTEE